LRASTGGPEQRVPREHPFGQGRGEEPAGGPSVHLRDESGGDLTQQGCLTRGNDLSRHGSTERGEKQRVRVAMTILALGHEIHGKTESESWGMVCELGSTDPVLLGP